MVAAAKLPVLNPGEFELCKMRIEQYFLMTGYALWEVIVNGDSPLPKRTVDGVKQTYPPTTTEEKLARKNELKARVPKLQTAIQGDALLHYDAEMELMNLILLSIPNEIYNSMDACTLAKDMWKRVERLMRGTIQNKVDRETQWKEIEELSANICLMAQKFNQLNYHFLMLGPSFDSAFISEVQSSSNTENEEQMYPTHTKIINSTIGDDQIDSDIIFDSPNGNVNSGCIEKDNNVFLILCALEI
ncbi:hypothetical protein Tco_0544789 [Tanacetum coccineum]